MSSPPARYMCHLGYMRIMEAPLSSNQSIIYGTVEDARDDGCFLNSDVFMRLKLVHANIHIMLK